MTAKTLSPLAAQLATARIQLAFFREQVKTLTEQVKHEKFALANDRLVQREAKAAARREREQNAIAKAQLKLQKLLDKQTGLVGVKAAKANRKPSKAVTIGAEDNAIAAALVAKRAQKEMF